MQDIYTGLLRDFADAEGLDPEALCATEEIEIAGLSLALAFDGDETFGDLVYACGLGAVQAERAGAVHRWLLEANHLWAGTAGATLSLQPETGTVLIAGRLDLDGLTAPALGAVLEDFVDVALYWRRVIHEAPLVASENPSGELQVDAFA
ncbi:MAG: CesT family type III secretion system chaperone [Ramlibacter sp.]